MDARQPRRRNERSGKEASQSAPPQLRRTAKSGNVSRTERSGCGPWGFAQGVRPPPGTTIFSCIFENAVVLAEAPAQYDFLSACCQFATKVEKAYCRERESVYNHPVFI
jgi:hypothetical protein